MANWEKLDKEFYDVVNNLTAQQWQSWREQQNNNRMIRKQQKEMTRKIRKFLSSFLQNPSHTHLQICQVSRTLKFLVSTVQGTGMKRRKWLL